MQYFYPHVAAALAPYTGLDVAEVQRLLAPPPDSKLGDVAFPCFPLAKALKKAPPAIAQELAEKINATALPSPLASITAAGPYLNIYLDRPAAAAILTESALLDDWGSSHTGDGRTVAIDLSSPNIAKPMHLGHLRSTVIGNSLVKIYRHQGWHVVAINHLGDWGTQFGKQMVAYYRWGDKAVVEANPIDELLKLYQMFGDKAKEQPELEDEARAYFKKLEEGDPDIRKIWQFIVDESMKEIGRIYEMLDVTFDAVLGESFYEDKMPAVIQELRDKGLLVESEGAHVVMLDEEKLPACLIIKKDGATIYATRDLAAAEYRHDHFKADKLLYVVDQGQSVHFRQVFAVLKKMGHAWAENCHHVSFGVLTVGGKRLRTRAGDVIYLEELLTKATEYAAEIIAEKNPTLANAAQVAQSVGVGAVVFNDLRQNRVTDVDFTWEEALNFDGQTGPYVQYTHARASKILRDAGFGGVDSGSAPSAVFSEPEEWAVLTQIGGFPAAVQRAEERMEPSAVAQHLLTVAQAFNRFYHDKTILKAEPAVRAARVALVAATVSTLRTGLALLGMDAPEQM